MTEGRGGRDGEFGMGVLAPLLLGDRCNWHIAVVNIHDSTSIRRPFDCLSKVIKVTVT